ncbi:hypothetical protein DIPPA_58020 [Diplonema papillatum]|nr:hypothetical protein DIPPA_58020 [Diplonema papillatum]
MLSMDRPFAGLGRAGPADDNCLLCGLSVSRRSVHGAPVDNVCYQCASSEGKTSDIWKLCYVLKSSGYEHIVQEVITRVIADTNSRWEQDSSCVTVPGSSGEFLELSRTVNSLREAKLNTNIKTLYYGQKGGHLRKLAVTRRLFKNNPAKNGIPFLEAPTPECDVQCLIRLGKVKQVDAWPAPSLKQLHSEGFQSAACNGVYIVPARDQVLHVLTPPPQSMRIQWLIVVLPLLIFLSYYLAFA